MTYIGTSGFTYKYWRSSFSQKWVNADNFYPTKLKQRDELRYYAKHFNVVEINSTFYKLPTVKAITKWRDETPEDFKFIIKMSKYATHNKLLKEFPNCWDTLWEIIQHLEGKLLGILIQLPPRFHFKEENLRRVREAAEYLDQYGLKYYFEFRHSTWFNNLSSISDLPLVCVHVNNDHKGYGEISNGFNPPIGNYQYFRLHGTSPTHPYKGRYSATDLALVASLEPEIAIFDNTDSFAMINGNVLYDEDINLIHFMGLPVSKVIPDAVNDALRFKLIG